MILLKPSKRRLCKLESLGSVNNFLRVLFSLLLSVFHSDFALRMAITSFVSRSTESLCFSGPIDHDHDSTTKALVIFDIFFLIFMVLEFAYEMQK